jgi:hypothetical protein
MVRPRLGRGHRSRSCNRTKLERDRTSSEVKASHLQRSLATDEGIRGVQARRGVTVRRGVLDEWGVKANSWVPAWWRERRRHAAGGTVREARRPGVDEVNFMSSSTTPQQNKLVRLSEAKIFKARSLPFRLSYRSALRSSTSM